MAPQYSENHLDRVWYETKIRGFRVKELQTICSRNSLDKAGVKAELQGRIIREYKLTSRKALRDVRPASVHLYQRLCRTIEELSSAHETRPWPSSSSVVSKHTMRGSSNRSPSTSSQPSGKSSTVSGHPPFPEYERYGSGANGAPTTVPSGRSIEDILFRGGPAPYAAPIRPAMSFNQASPFYSLDTRVGDVRMLPVMMKYRYTSELVLKVSEYPVLNRCINDKSHRVMVLCGEKDYGAQDIAFPQQSELKVNGDEIIGQSLRGLKGKRGSTRPIDVTDHLRLNKSDYANRVQLTYAMTTQNYYLAIYVCKAFRVEELIVKIQGKKIRKESVLSEMTKAAADTDVVATSQVMSLKCPISGMRLKVPCRSTLCKHISCFDATSYLQLQEQGPQWKCPICNHDAHFDNLAVDDYTKDILDNTSESDDQVTIEPHGGWKTSGEEREPKKCRTSTANVSYLIGDEDDESSSFSDGSGHVTAALVTAAAAFDTPSLGTPAPTSARGSTAVAGEKRAVIDLTLSSDDEEEPMGPASKRRRF